MLHGSCLCGQLRYEIDLEESDARKTSTCHCRCCRKITGATTSLNLAVPLSAFKLSSGTMKNKKVKHIDDGFEFLLAFCEDCGSPIYALPANSSPEVAFIQVGTLDTVEPLKAIPEVELNVKHRLDWVREVDGAIQRNNYVD